MAHGPNPVFGESPPLGEQHGQPKPTQRQDSITAQPEPYSALGGRRRGGSLPFHSGGVGLRYGLLGSK